VISIVALRNELSACTTSYKQTPYDIYLELILRLCFAMNYAVKLKIIIIIKM